ncbi:ribosomal protein S30-domain-containing protein [Lentinula detonsa]|uniref:40S ribosomal protein S30 n=1 Tax=Lentinula detonsa TaxID=2804962 RepID=A0A9W8P3W4_9AGAR|nr:ribosomal protein S30-domain-containing protein [Lentinula detonsa]
MGKVHGSLARAGKVKSQTPKVEAQEKKKTPKGRAKKRILYNRRCVMKHLCAFIHPHAPFSQLRQCNYSSGRQTADVSA